MQASWAIALAEDSPVLTVPWADFVDLRARPEAIETIQEARENPPLATVLARFNAAHSPWATAKCDRWAMDEDDLHTAFLELDLDTVQGRSSTWNGIGSYIDIYLQNVAQFLSLYHHRALLPRLTSAAEREQHPMAMLELTLRRCIAEGNDGYAITAFVYAVGEDAAQAEMHWAAGLAGLADILLSEAVTAIE